MTVTAAARRGGRPTLDDARRKSEQLLDAATELFVDRGFDGTTMEAIALAAGMGKQAVYQRYPNKEAMFTAVIARLSEDEFPAQASHDDSEPLAEGLPRRIRDYLAFALGPKSQLVCRLVMREGHRFPALVALLQESTVERMIDPLARYLDVATGAGRPRQIDSIAIASCCIDLIFAEAMRSTFQQRSLSSAQVERSARTIAEFVLPGLEHRAEE